MNPGLFIVFEGLEGSGKTTQAKILQEKLQEKGFATCRTREPGGTPLAEDIRKLLVTGKPDSMDGTTEALLFNAARRSHIQGCIQPAMARGDIVICDRFFGSTLALQSAAGMNGPTLLQLHEMACDGLVPDVTILLTGDVERLLNRAQAREQKNTSQQNHENRFEAKGVAYHQKVKEGFETHMNWDNVITVCVEDETGNMRTLEDIANEIENAVIPHLPKT